MEKSQNSENEKRKTTTPKFVQPSITLREEDYPKISSEIPRERIKLALEPEAFERHRIEVRETNEKERKDFRTAVATAITTLLAILELGAQIKDFQIDYSHGKKVEEAMKPIRQEVHEILQTERFDIYDQEAYKNMGSLIPCGFSYNHRNISEIMNQKFAESILEGQIYLGELNNQILYKENGNMDQIINGMNVEYTKGANTMQEYIENLHFLSIDDYYEAMKEVQYNISEHTEEQDGPKL